MEVEKALNKKQVCEILGISPSTLDRRVQEGAIKRFKCGHLVKFRPEDVRDYMKGGDKG